ncbi:MAG: AAA family ATPase [Prevotella sp.]|jgi:cytidylate kinase
MENHNHIIISLGRQVGSGGLTLARMLAEDLGCKLYDRELLYLAAKESGFSETIFEKNDEQKGFFKTLTHLHVPFVSDSNFFHNDISDENLYRLQSEVIQKAADEGSCVFVGRTADYVLRNRKDMLRLFITSPLDVRVKRVAERQSISENAAAKYIKEKEEDRASYYNYYTGKEWGAAESYDLCIDSSILGLEGTEKFIASFVREKFK